MQERESELREGRTLSETIGRDFATPYNAQNTLMLKLPKLWIAFKGGSRGHAPVVSV